MNPSSLLPSAIHAKRALLRQQTQLLGNELPWLGDPDCIPIEALGSSAHSGDLPDQCFHLAAWMVGEIVLSANRLHPKLDWENAFELYDVPAEQKLLIKRAVLEPVTRYAPGMIALAEIVAATPLVSTRACVDHAKWGCIARLAEGFGAKISCDGTDVQVVIRNYLRDTDHASTSRATPVLDSALLKLDDETGVSSVTPIHDLVSIARAAVIEHLGSATGMCVAMHARAPVCDHAPGRPTTMYGAIWTAYVAAVERLVFPNVDLSRVVIRPQAGPDPHVAAVMDRLARERAADLKSRVRLSQCQPRWQESEPR
jgi:hypothetical protein